MANTYTPGSGDPSDALRLLISDVGGTDGTSFLFDDDEINNFLSLRDGVFRAAALALRTMAGNEAMVSKRITFLEMKTDGAAVADSLRKLADNFDDQANADGDEDGVVIIELITEPFGARQRRLGF